MEATMRARIRLALLVLVLGATALINFHLHWNPFTGESTPYPRHLDEYVHWGVAANMSEVGEVAVGDPFTGSGREGFALSDDLHRRGFHVALASFQLVTGIEWLTIFHFGPALVATFLALAIYVFAERWDAGLEAAFFVAAIPTTLRFLGPAILVPIAFSLPFIILGAWLLFHGEGLRSLSAFVILTAAGWTFHSGAGFVFTVLGILYALAHVTRSPKRAAAVALIVIGFAALAFPAYERFVKAFMRTPTLPALHDYFLIFGVVPLFLAVLGTIFLAWDPLTRRAAAIFATIWMGCAFVFAIRLEHNVDLFILYDRLHMAIYALSAILAGVALARIRKHVLATPLVRWPAARAALLVLVLIVPAVSVAQAAQSQMEKEEDFFAVLDDETYAVYAAAATTPLPPGKALVDGLSTMAFTAMTDKPTYPHVSPSSRGVPPDVAKFFEEGAVDNAFMERRGISVVVTLRPVLNPDLFEISRGVYVRVQTVPVNATS